MVESEYIERNLGWVKAVHEGSDPPDNHRMLWFDTAFRIMKRYDFTLLQWVVLGGGSGNGVVYDYIEEGQTVYVPFHTQYIIEHHLTVLGLMVVEGSLIINN